ncbi:MAG: hypothetical protein HQL56_14135, partial [Magnetococcales bacterium]|nr:hypothetical protein [Magnetococcales bacterium]
MNFQVTTINQFHMASANYYERIDDEIQKIRAHHNEEHLRDIAPGEVSAEPNHYINHMQDLFGLFAQLDTLWEKF